MVSHKFMAGSLSDSESDNRKDLVRKSERVRKVTERLQVDPQYKTYERAAVIMATRKCQAQGCDYTVGDAGEIMAGAAGEIEYIKVHLTTCRFVTGKKQEQQY